MTTDNHDAGEREKYACPILLEYDRIALMAQSEQIDGPVSSPDGKEKSLCIYCLMKLLNVWAMCFRAIVIIAIAYMTLTWIGAKGVTDIPVRLLTIKDVMKPALSAGVIIGCIAWLLSPPKPEYDGHNPWGFWLGLAAFMGLGYWLFQNVYQ